jgi:GAF domain-containing protein
MNSPLVVNDASVHPLIRDNPAVSSLGVRAYAGVPVSGADGLPIGALCVVDEHARDWGPADVQVLRDLASVLGAELELREMKRSVLETLSGGKKTPRRRARG